MDMYVADGIQNVVFLLGNTRKHAEERILLLLFYIVSSLNSFIALSSDEKSIPTRCSLMFFFLASGRYFS